MPRRIAYLATVTALALSMQPSAVSAEPAGLWPSTFAPNQPPSCGSFPSDGRFCHTGNGDQTSVELGLKFTSSKDVDVVGVRVYRTDAGPVTGSLWAMDGTRRATAAFAGTTTHGWQDALFSAPVPIQTGQTQIASYFAPTPDYAFEYDTFTSAPYTVGPITALQSVEGDGNGVFCYEASCFPRNSAETNYWVTPLWAYRFTGFYQPVDNGLWNTAKAGSAIPVKFSLGGDQGLDVIKPGSPTMTGIPCANAAAAVDAIE
jgi:hypothetical protein